MTNAYRTSVVMQNYSTNGAVKPGLFYQVADERLDYKIDYTEVLETSEIIADSDWTIAANEQLDGLDKLILSNQSFTNKTSTIFVSTIGDIGYGYSYIILNTILTSQNRQFSRYFVVSFTGVETSNYVPPDVPQDGPLNNERLVIPFSFGDASPVVVATLTNRFIKDTSIDIEVAFNGSGSSISLGNQSDPQAYISTVQNDPYQVGTYTTHPGIMTPTDVQFDIILTIVPGTATIGSGFIILEVN